MSTSSTVVYRVGPWATTWHWPNGRHQRYSMCGHSLHYESKAPAQVDVNNRCLGNGCADLWHQFMSKPEPESPTPPEATDAAIFAGYLRQLESEAAAAGDIKRAATLQETAVEMDRLAGEVQRLTSVVRFGRGALTGVAAEICRVGYNRIGSYLDESVRKMDKLAKGEGA